MQTVQTTLPSGRRDIRWKAGPLPGPPSPAALSPGSTGPEARATALARAHTLGSCTLLLRPGPCVTPFLSAHHLFPIFPYIQLRRASAMFRNVPNSTRTLVFPLPRFSSMNTQPLVFYLSSINSLTLITLKQIPNTTSFHPQTFRDVSVRILKK